MGTEKLHKLCYQPGVVMYVDDYNICRDMEVSPDVSVLHMQKKKEKKSHREVKKKLRCWNSCR